MKLCLFFAGFLTMMSQTDIAFCEVFEEATEAAEAVEVEMSPLAQLISFLLPLLLILLIVFIVRKLRSKESSLSQEELTSYNPSGHSDAYSPSGVEIYCKNCGSRIEDATNSFCEKCGARLKV